MEVIVSSVKIMKLVILVYDIKYVWRLKKLKYFLIISNCVWVIVKKKVIMFIWWWYLNKNLRNFVFFVFGKIIFKVVGSNVVI